MTAEHQKSGQRYGRIVVIDFAIICWINWQLHCLWMKEMKRQTPWRFTRLMWHREHHQREHNEERHCRYRRQ